MARGPLQGRDPGQNVETDDRVYIYIVNRFNTGMHILELTGQARSVAGPP